MKSRSIILITLSLLYVFAANAQEKKVALGLAFNPSLNWLKANSSGLETHGNKIGFNYGLIADFNFGENYSYATGLFINNGGGKLKSDYSENGVEFSEEMDLKIQSVRMPVALRMRTKEIGYLKYYGLFGFNLDYVINADGTFKVNGGAEQTQDIKGDISPMNISLALGAGVMYNLSGTTNFVLGVGFNNGFIDVLKGSNGDEDLKATANQFTLNLGILF